MISTAGLEQLLAKAVCRVTLGERASLGTGWLLSGGETIITAGHLFAPDKAAPVSVSFPDVATAVPARVVHAACDPDRGIDFAVLEADVPADVPGLPISLERAPHGPVISMGYGLTLRDMSAAAGEFVGPYDPQSKSANRLFRIRSIELAEEGYSGCPIVSTQSGAVVALQIEAVTSGRGARDTVLAMPLYRVAEGWSRLSEIEALQAENRDGHISRMVLLANVAGSQQVAEAVGARLTEAAFTVAALDIADADTPARVHAELSDAWAVVLLRPDQSDDSAQTRALVVSAILRQVPVVVVASSRTALPAYLRSLFVVDSDPDARALGEQVAMVVGGLAGDQARMESLAGLSDALEEIQARSLDPIRFQPHIDELRSLIGGWPTRLERQDRRIKAGTQVRRAQPGPASVVPAVGVRPFDPEHLFRNRIREAEALSSYLADDAVGVVAIVGRAGMGKTALAARVMATLRGNRWMHADVGPRIDGLVYLSTRTSSGISSAEVVLKLSRLVDEPGMVRTWFTANMPLPERLAQVIEAVSDRRIVVLLDNFEDLLDESGRIVGDDDLSDLVSGLVAADTRLKFLLTSRERVEFDPAALARTRVIKVRSGLPEDDSIRMLRELDPQAEYGLQQSAAPDLAAIAAKVQGIPRALQLVVGLLASDPMLAVSDLMDPGLHLVDDSLNGIIDETFSRLDESARWVLLALALLGRPESLSALDFVLRPFAPGVDVPAVVRRLIRTQIVSVDKLSRRMALHPADRAYLLGQAAEQRGATLALMRRRAAEYYVSVAPKRADVEDIEGVRPLLFAVEHLLSCEDYNAALDILDQVDDLLEYWGYYKLVINLRLVVAEGISGEEWIQNAMRLGRLYWLTGEATASASWLARAENAALNQPGQIHLAAILVDLAASQRDSGHMRDSLKTFLRAFREASGANPLVIARGLIQVTHTVRSLGFLHTAIACTDRAIEISSRPEPAGEQSRRARFLNAGAQINAAISDRLRGDLAQAKVRLDTAMHLAEGIGDRGLIAYVHCGVASIERAAGNPARGISGLLGALEIYEEIGDRWGQAACLAIMCWAYADMMDTGAAARYAEQGRSVAMGCNPRAFASSWPTASWQGGPATTRPPAT